MFNMDFTSRWLNELLYPFGISMDPSNALIGYDGWLYLGDAHAKIQTRTRVGSTLVGVQNNKMINASMQKWERWLTTQGVKQLKVMVSPNKATMYPEHLPIWAKPTEKSELDSFFNFADRSIFIDLRVPLLEAKAAFKEDIYYKTDTHWNLLGAGLAFKHFINHIRTEVPDLTLLSDEMYEILQVTPRSTGDLARFLRLENKLQETEVIINAYSQNFPITQFDFNSGEEIYKGSNIQLSAPHTPQQIVSHNALNKAKVLWIRDSFGNSMSPLMAATFSETLQIHYAMAFQPVDILVGLVQKFKPDYVFITAVERDSRHPLFNNPPPDA